MRIMEVYQDKTNFLPLLLLADEQENTIDRYLEHGTMFVLDDNSIKAECVVTDEGNCILEIKNIATDPAHQKNGFGKAHGSIKEEVVAHFLFDVYYYLEFYPSHNCTS